MFVGVAALVEHCTALMELDLCGCIEITNYLLIELERILQDERMSTCVHMCLGGLSNAMCYIQYLLIVTRIFKV